MLSLLAPSALWLLLLLPIIVVLHFVRQRKRQQEVSALFLWNEAQVLARRRRRISPTLLLLLQLLFSGLLALALAQPRLVTRGAPPQVFVLDASASMAAAEPSGTRLAQAVAAADALLRGAGEVAVVRAGLGARVVLPLTGDHAAVRAALADLSAADAEAALPDALALARSLAPDAEVHLFTDQLSGRVGGTLGERAGSTGNTTGNTTVTVHPVGTAEAAPNIGIGAFELAYGQLFVSLVSNQAAPQEVALVLEQTPPPGAAGGAVQEILRTTLLVPANGQANTSLPAPAETGLYRARLEGLLGENLPGDALPLDDEAFAGSRALSVRLEGEAPALERVLQALPGTELTGTELTGTQLTGTEQPLGEVASVTVRAGSGLGSVRALPAGDVILFSPPAPEPDYTEIADWARSDPLLRFADLTGVIVAPSAAPLPLPLARAEVLAKTTDLTPVLLRWQDAGRTVIAFRFNPAQSDLSRRPAFPILLANALEGFRSEAVVPLGTALGPETWLSEPGRREVGGRSYTTAPLPTSESRLAATASATAGATGAQGSSQATRSPALWLVLVALALLLAEWVLWSRGRGQRRGQRTTRPRRPPLARR